MRIRDFAAIIKDLIPIEVKRTFYVDFNDFRFSIICTDHHAGLRHVVENTEKII